MSKTRYNLDLVFANVFFGANFSFYVSLTRNYLDFQQIFMLQVLSAAVFFIPFALFSRYSYRITWRDAGNILIVTLLIVYGWMYMLLWGASYTTPIDASVIATLGPAFTLIMDHLMHPRKYIGTRVVGVVCALVGAGILILGDGFSLTHGSRAQGNLFVLAAVVAIAVNTVIIKPQLEKLGTLVVMGWYYIIGLAITAPFFWKYIDHVPFLRLPLFAQAELGYILILGTVLPMYLLYRGTEKLTSVHTALYRYIQPVIAGILAITRGQAHFDAANITASVFIFAGVILVVVGYKYYVRHGLQSHGRRFARDVGRGRDDGPSQGAEHPAAEFVVGDAHAERPFVGDEVFGKPRGARQDGRQGRGGQLHHLEGDSRGLVDVADDHVGRGAQHEH